MTYGDTLLDVPMDRLERRLLSSRALAVMTVLENQDRWETSNVDVADGRVTTYEKPAITGELPVLGLRDAGDAGGGVRGDADERRSIWRR